MEKIIVLGSINMDLVTVVDRKPKDGETISGKSFFMAHGGKGANQAVSIARLGKKVKFLGKVGNDQFGNELLENLRKGNALVKFNGKAIKIPKSNAAKIIPVYGKKFSCNLSM